MKSKQKTLSNQASNALWRIGLVYQIEILCWGKFKSKTDGYTYISMYVDMHTSMYHLVLICIVWCCIVKGLVWKKKVIFNDQWKERRKWSFLTRWQTLFLLGDFMFQLHSDHFEVQRKHTFYEFHVTWKSAFLSLKVTKIRIFNAWR